MESKGDNADVVQELINHGADIFHTSLNNENSLEVAVQKNHPNVLKCLLQAANVAKTGGQSLFQPNIDGNNLLHHACKRGSLECTKILLEFDNEILRKDKNAVSMVSVKNKEGLLPVDLAKKGGQEKIKEALDTYWEEKKLAADKMYNDIKTKEAAAQQLKMRKE